MRIAMIGTKGIPAKWGGIERYVEEISKRLLERGHSVSVYGSSWYLRDYEHTDFCGIQICRMPAFHAPATDALMNAFLATISISLRKFDIVHCHGYASYIWIPLLKMWKKPVVVTAHGFESGWENPKFGPLARKIIMKCFEIGVTKGDYVTAVGKHIQDKIRTHFEINAGLTSSGIDEMVCLSNTIIYKKHQLRPYTYLLYLGRIDPIKRIEWVVDLAANISDNLKIVVAGGPQDAKGMAYYNSLKNRAQGQNRVIFTGPVIGKEKYELLANCLLYVSASTNEGLPVSVLEALSCGRPCVLSDIPAHSELFTEIECGRLFRTNNKAHFLEQVTRLLRLNKSELGNMGVEAQKKVAGTYSWEKTADTFEKIYLSLLSAC